MYGADSAPSAVFLGVLCGLRFSLICEASLRWADEGVCPTYLVPNKPRIQAPRHAGVGGPLDDRPAIGKQSHLVGLTPELQHEVVMPHLAVRLEALVHNSEVYRPVAFVNLHGIPPTQRDVRPPLTFEMNEVAFSSSPASRSRLAHLDLRALVRPHIQRQQCPP